MNLADAHNWRIGTYYNEERPTGDRPRYEGVQARSRVAWCASKALQTSATYCRRFSQSVRRAV
jgi:hypothetical protein